MKTTECNIEVIEDVVRGDIYIHVSVACVCSVYMDVCVCVRG